LDCGWGVVILLLFEAENPQEKNPQKKPKKQTWSAPRVTTAGHTHSRASVMLSASVDTGVTPRILGYKLIGESVPLVITTDWNFENTGFIAKDASRHANCSTASGMCGRRSSYGSMMTSKPFLMMVWLGFCWVLVVVFDVFDDGFFKV
jgi:hypothetical protein